MAISAHDLLTDPALFLYELDDTNAHYQVMTREDVARSIFLDGRIRHGNRPNFKVPLEQLIALYETAKPEWKRVGWIFHIAQCGSTLLARALDHPDRSLVLREPAALRRLGVMAGSASKERTQSLDLLLPVVSSALSKRWNDHAPLVIKANVPVNFIASDLMARDPQGPAILLYFPLANYVAATLRTPGHVDWVERVFDEMRLVESTCCTTACPANAAEKAAALWFAQMKKFEELLGLYPGTRTLHARELFDNAENTINCAARLFGIDLSEVEAQEIAQSELYHSYSKNPALDYDPEVRLAREAEAMDRLSPEIEVARQWAQSARERHGLVSTLDRPLFGESALLIS